MEQNGEIKALMQLIDDPDEQIYEVVSNKIVSLGRDIIPNLEDLWENTLNEFKQDRIEKLIHRVHMRELEAEFTNWSNTNGSILDGALLVARYQFPDLDTNFILKEISKLSKNIWLELNQYLTPIEKVNVFNGIYYYYYKMLGVEVNYEAPNEFLINKVLESKTGNAFGHGLTYLILSEQLDLPIYAIRVPNQFLMGWLQHVHNTDTDNPYQLLFYINPANGDLYSINDVETYVKRLDMEITSDIFKPLNTKAVIQYVLQEMSKCFDNDKYEYKRNDLLKLADMLRQ